MTVRVAPWQTLQLLSVCPPLATRRHGPTMNVALWRKLKADRRLKSASTTLGPQPNCAAKLGGAPFVVEVEHCGGGRGGVSSPGKSAWMDLIMIGHHALPGCQHLHHPYEFHQWKAKGEKYYPIHAEAVLEGTTAVVRAVVTDVSRKLARPP